MQFATLHRLLRLFAACCLVAAGLSVPVVAASAQAGSHFFANVVPSVSAAVGAIDQFAAPAASPHTFVDPKTGKWRRWMDELNAQQGLSASSVDRSWLAMYRAAVIDAMDMATRSADHRVEASVSAQLLAYARMCPVGATAKNCLYVNAIDEAYYGIKVLTVISRLGVMAQPGTASLMRDSWLAAPGGCDELSGAPHNIRVWMLAYRALANKVVRADEQAFRQCLTRLTQMIDAGTQATGGLWFEDSVHYHYYTMSALAALLSVDEVRQAEQPPLSRLKAQLLNMHAAMDRLKFPDGSIPAMNDGKACRSCPGVGLLRQMARVFECAPLPPEPEAASGQIESCLRVNLPTVAQMKSAAGGHVTIISGLHMAKLEKDRWVAALRYGQRSRSHAQPESLALDLFHDGQWVVEDPGSAAYGSRLQRDFFKRGVGQNVPLVNGEGQYKVPDAAVITRADGVAGVLTARHDSFQPGLSVTRQVVVSVDHVSDTIKVTGALLAKSLGATYHTRCAYAGPHAGTRGRSGEALLRNAFLTPEARLIAPHGGGVVLNCSGRRFALFSEHEQDVLLDVYDDPVSAGSAGAMKAVYVQAPAGLRELKIKISSLD